MQLSRTSLSRTKQFIAITLHFSYAIECSICELFFFVLIECLLYLPWNICSNRNLFDVDCAEKLLDAIISIFIKDKTSVGENPVVLTIERKEILLTLP